LLLKVIFGSVARGAVTIGVYFLLDDVDHAFEEDFSFDEDGLAADAAFYFESGGADCFVVVKF